MWLRHGDKGQYIHGSWMIFRNLNYNHKKKHEKTDKNSLALHHARNSGSTGNGTEMGESGGDATDGMELLEQVPGQHLGGSD